MPSRRVTPRRRRRSWGSFAPSAGWRHGTISASCRWSIAPRRLPTVSPTSSRDPDWTHSRTSTTSWRSRSAADAGWTSTGRACSCSVARAAVDLLVRNGGTAILSETPEIYGAEHLLTRRAVSREVGEKLIERIKWWEDYTARNKGEMNNNPSPGNKAGGLTTILEKSLGAVAKGGTSNLVAVYEYAEPVTERGFVYMDTPGYDPVSATGQVAGGANMIVFTTGRGSAYGCAPSPSLKLATNTALWERQEEDIDINCGEIVDGTSTVAQMGERFFRLILDTASGAKSKSEMHGYGQNEFVPWYLGAVM